MITIECKTSQCPNANTPFFVLGKARQVMCGGCQTMIDPTDITDDPPFEERFMTE